MSHLFLSGVMGRSGTTLLELMLNMHPDICISPENTCFEYLFRKLKQNNHQHYDKEIIKDLLINDKKLNSWPNYNLDLDYLLNVKDGITNLIMKIMISYSNSQNKTPLYFGNKKGFYGRGLGETVKKYFPAAKFIFIYRDPRDIINSSIKSFKNSTFNWAVSEICIRHTYIKFLKEKYINDVFILKYEDLVLKTEPELKKICEFLELKYDNNMQNYHRNNKFGENLIGSTSHIHENSKKPLNKDLVFKWKKTNELSNKQMRLVNYFCKEINKSKKYEHLENKFDLFDFVHKNKISKMISESIKSFE